MKKIALTFVVAILCIVIGMAAAAMAEGHTHTYGEWHVKTAATCATAGTKVRMCEECGNVESESIAKLAHTYGEWNVKTAATCATAGTKVRMCENCGNVESESIPTTGHTYGEWNVKTAATCVTAGTKVRMCENCGNVESEAIPTTGHTYGEWNVKTAATCETAGIKVRMCENCGNVESAEIPANGHTEVVDKAVAATCTETGLTEGKRCSACNEVIVMQEVTDVLGHDYKKNVVAPTTTSRGYTEYTCKRCGDSYVSNYTSKTKEETTAAPVVNPYLNAYGSIVTDVEREYMDYTAKIEVVNEMDQEIRVLVIVAEPEEDGVYATRNLHLSDALLKQLNDEEIDEIQFVVGSATISIPVISFADEALVQPMQDEECDDFIVTLAIEELEIENAVSDVYVVSVGFDKAEVVDLTSVVADIEVLLQDAGEATACVDAEGTAYLANVEENVWAIEVVEMNEFVLISEE